MSWVLVAVLFVFNILLVANYVQSIRLMRRIVLQNNLLSFSLFQQEIVIDEVEEPHLRIVENPPSVEDGE